jgi:hypothetical protein
MGADMSADRGVRRRFEELFAPCAKELWDRGLKS